MIKLTVRGKMKKIYALILSISLVIIFVPSTYAGEEFLDQSSTEGTGSLKICTGAIMYQTFIPTVNRIHKIEIDVSNASGQVNSNIKTLTGDGWEDVNYAESVTVVDGWNTFDFIDFPVTPGSVYAINVYADCSSGAQWKYSAGNKYSNGIMIWQGNEQPTQDFNFKVYGELDESLLTETPVSPDVVTPIPEDSVSSQATAQTDDLTNQGLTNETLGQVSTTIAKPNELTAKFVTKDETVTLSWKPSTTKDIDGYKIFRSEQEKTGYLKAGEVKKDILEFTDKYPVSNKTFFYQVRAFKNNVQSASSNTATIKIPTIAKKSPVAVQKPAQIEKSFIENNWPFLVLILVAAAGVGLLLYRRYKIRKRLNQSPPPQDLKNSR